ncbi:MAG: hypothetical protein K0S82_2768 [Gaiellaceae bacterium]|nr:hypothetical protein [Gaiellaceae bacterium]
MNSRYSSIWLFRFPSAPEDALVELDPVIHPAELDVADDVVEGDQPDPAGRLSVLDRGPVAGQVRPRIVPTVHERVDDLAVGADRRQLDTAELVLDPARLGNSACAPLDGLAVRLLRARDLQPDRLGAVPVPAGELGDLVLGAEAARQDEADVALLEHVGRTVADARLGARVRGAGEPERLLVVVGRLLGVADPELDVVPALQRHEVRHVSDLSPSSRKAHGIATRACAS